MFLFSEWIFLTTVGIYIYSSFLIQFPSRSRCGSRLFRFCLFCLYSIHWSIQWWRTWCGLRYRGPPFSSRFLSVAVWSIFTFVEIVPQWTPLVFYFICLLVVVQSVALRFRAIEILILTINRSRLKIGSWFSFFFFVRIICVFILQFTLSTHTHVYIAWVGSIWTYSSKSFFSVFFVIFSVFFCVQNLEV